MINLNTAKSRACTRRASVMVTVMLLALASGIIVSAILLRTSHGTRELARHSARQHAFNAAEAGLELGLYVLRADTNWGKLPSGIVPLTTMDNGATYTVSSAINSALTEVTLRSVGKARQGSQTIPRTLEVKASRAPPKALDYMMFGNAVGFHNHMKQAYGLSISNKVWSNGLLEAHAGLVLKGEYTAVGSINIKTDSALPPTNISNATLRSGVPTSPYYAGKFNEEIPVRKPFPTYDFARAKTLATQKGTFFSSATSFQNYLLARAVNYSPRQKYNLPIPQSNDRDFSIIINKTGDYVIEPTPGVYKKLSTDKNGVTTTSNYNATDVGRIRKIEVSDSMFYITGSLSLSFGYDTVLIFRNCSLIAEGAIAFACPVEFYGPETEIAIATMNKLDITGSKGPARIEGVTYSMGATHIHQTDKYGSVYFAGIEIADYIHNCEWFQMEYRPYPNVNGLNDSSVFGNTLKVYGWREIN